MYYNQIIHIIMIVHKIFLFILLLSLAGARKNLKQAVKEAQQDHKTIVEANHFYSNVETFTNYEINSVQKDKSILFIITQKEKTEQQLRHNPITITLNSGSLNQTCVFQSFTNLCGIKNVQEPNMKLKIECKSTPCELQWVIYQPAAIDQDGKNEIERYVEVNQDYNHATIIVSCNDPNIKSFIDDLKLYTNSLYQKISNNGVAYYLFDNENKGYFFLTSENPAAKACANIITKHSVDEVVFNQKNILEDFILPNKPNQYSIKNAPDFDMRIDSFFHIAKGALLSQKDGVIINLIGQNGSQKSILSTITVLGEEKNTVDFSSVFKLPTIKYQHMYFEIKSIGPQILVTSIDFVSSERHEVNLGESSFFQLKKGQTINFKLIAETHETDDKKMTYIYVSDEKKFKLSQQECKKQAGCQFTLQALEDSKGDLYFGQKAVKDVAEIVSTNFENSFTKKLREGQSLLLKTQVKANKAIQALVNSPNTLIYVSSKEKCPTVSAECHQKVLNSHNPIVYQSKSNVEVYFLVTALDICQFTLSIITSETQYVELSDSNPFAYLFDDSESELWFQFKVTKKQDVFFNLVSPINQLLLVVYNTAKDSQTSQGGVTSNEGFITFEKDNMDSLSFLVKVQKKQQFLNKYIHFTILVSTKQGNIRLEPGLQHFQTLPPSQTRDFVFEFEPKKEMMVNFYLHNILSNLQKVEVQVKLSSSDDYADQNAIFEQTIASQSDVIEMKQVAQKLCKNEAGQNCELFLRISNKMEIELDITLTLLITDTIIQLKDGIWGTYQINHIAETTHFYFLPKNKNKSITVQYRSEMIDLKVMYTIWKTNDQGFSPDEWPFPTDAKKEENKDRLQQSPTKFIHIDSNHLKDCWPNCVILISIFKDTTSLISTYEIFQQLAQFKILASSNFIQIPEKTKIDIILRKEEAKHLIVDLKYVLGKESLTFFTYFTIGSVKLTGNVYQQDNPRCPLPEEESDFRFGVLETQISIKTIMDMLSQHDMNNDKNKYICILAHAFLDSKFSIEYSSDNQIMKRLTLDSYETKKLGAHQVSLFQIDGSQEMFLKITRTSGFPYISNKICKEGDDFEKCLDDFKSDDAESTQLADKMTTITITPCQKCIVFIKIRSEQPSEVNLHAQSKYTETELLENQMITDDLDKDNENKYLITSIRNEELIINIQILHGQIEINIFDFDKINITKSNQKNANVIHVAIPPKKQPTSPPSYGSNHYGYYDFSFFLGLHMHVKSKNGKEAMYTITYSSGDPELYLQDGLIFTYALTTNKTVKFLYKNPAFTKVYLHISMPDAKVLNKLKIKMHALANEFDEQTGVQLTPQKPQFNKKTPNPTMIMELSPNKFYQIEITNPEKQMSMLTMGINNQEIIFLPVDHEFPVQLKKGEHIYMVVNVPFQTYLSVEIKKCDESKLSVGYTLVYDDFINEEFSFQQEVGEEELLTQLLIKAKTGNAYIKLKSPEDDDSLITVKALYSYNKTKKESTKPGNNGLVEYRMIDYSNAELTFSPITCPNSNKNCHKEFAYSYISSQEIQNIYAQLMCSSISFDLLDRQIVIPSDFKPISASTNKQNKVQLNHQISQNTDFIGIRAVNSKTQEIVYYRPIELMTVLGQISKGTKGNGFIVAVVVLVFICVCLIISRRMFKSNKSQYAPLSNFD